MNMNSSTDRKNKILSLMNDPSFRPMKEKELAIMMQVVGEDRPLFKQCLNELLTEGAITVSKRGKYSLPQQETLEGVFSASGRGFGFVSVDGIEDDFYINEKNTGTALDGDTVVIEPMSDSRPGRHREAVIVAVKERATDFVVGTYEATRSQYGFVIPDSM